MYKSPDAFRLDAFACGYDYYSDDSLTPSKLAAAYTIYRQASGGTKLKDFDDSVTDWGITIVGRLALRGDNGAWIPSSEAFPAIDEILQQNLRTLGDETGEQGSILNSKEWSLLANDAWLLGGIHAGTEFHFASPLRWENLWAATERRMTVTAREAICIMACNYEILRPSTLEAVAVCIDTTKARETSLLSLKEALVKYSDSESLRAFYETIPPAARS